MQAEIISVGTEITSGAKLDTNSQWLSLQLADLGIPVLFHTTVSDEIQPGIAAVQAAVNRVDLVLLTGGLGPTLDDLTRECLAGAAGTDLELDEASLAHIEAFFRGRGRGMPPRNRVQAMFPRGSSPLPNPIGTAPGIWMEFPREGREPCRVAALPGVPSEMHQMFHEQVRPRLPGSGRVIRRAQIHCFGIGESATEELLGDLTARGQDPDVGITAHDATITLRIIAQGATADECIAKIDAASAIIRKRLGNYVYGTEDENLQDVVLRMLGTRDRTFATVEAATAGLLTHSIASVSEARTAYRGGVVLAELSEPLDAARQVRTRMGADYALAIGSDQEVPNVNSRQSLIPIVLLGPGDAAKTEVLTWNGNPAIIQSRAVKAALNLLRLELVRENEAAIPSP